VTPSTALVTGAGALIGAASGAHAALAARRARPAPPAAWAGILPALGLVLGIGVAVRVAPLLLAAASLLMLAAALPLSAIDAATRTLPDRLLLPAIPACAALLALAAARAGDYSPLWSALAAAALLLLAFTALALAAPGQLGFGDCKAAALCALPLGYLGWNRVLLGVLAAYLLAALYIIGARLVRRTVGRTFAFGPFLFAGALAALLLRP